MHSGGLRAAVAIPARDEADRLPSCLDALARQRGGHDQPVDPRAFAVLVFANNCRDATARIAREMAARSPFRLVVVEAALPPGAAHAGGARRDGRRRGAAGRPPRGVAEHGR